MTEKASYEELEKRIHELELEADGREKAEEALRQSEKKCRDLFNSVNDAFFVHELHQDAPGAILDVNNVACECYGYSREEFIGMRPERLIAGGPSDKELALIVNRLKKERWAVFEQMHSTKDGASFPVEVSAKVIELEGKSVLLAVARDISERKEAEKALKEKEDWYRTLFNSTNDAVFVVPVSHKPGGEPYLDVNDVACDRYGYTREEFLEMTPEDLHFRSLHDTLLVRIKKELRIKGIVVYESIHVTKDGRRINVETSARLFELGGKPVVLSISRDITERKLAEETLKKSEVKYRHLFNSGNDAVMVNNVSETGEPETFIDVNEVACIRYGYTKDEFLRLHRRDIDRALTPEKRQEIKKKLLAGKPAVFETVNEAKDGSRFPVEVNCSVISLEGKSAVYAVMRDITERKRAEEEKDKLRSQLQKAERMEAIGTLAGGVAHDFNNLLMGIQGRTSLMLLDIDYSHRFYDQLKGIEEHIMSAADLTRQLLGFARGGKYVVEPTDLNELVRKSSEMFGRTKKEINIHGKFQEKIWAADVDRSQIEQVLLNLFVNAWQSMPGGGDLYLETENVILDPHYTKPFSVGPGKYVKLSVTDSGIGMDEKTREKIFEPFFTTKEMGKGTGLGLASAYGIIKNHNGIINVYSEKGKGTTFNIYLPASEESVPDKKEVDHAQEIVKGTETILLVDDEDIVIEVGREVLQTLGYKVFVEKTGESAVQFYRNNADEIDGIILDMIMPNMGGGETFAKLKEMNPDVKVLLSSGYSLNGQAQRILSKGCKDFIQKPFTLEQLSKKLSEMLHGT